MPLGFPGGSAGGGSPRPMSWTLATDYDVSMVTSLAAACNWAARAAPDGTIHYAFIRDGSVFHARAGGPPTLVSAPTATCNGPPDLAFKPDGSVVVAWIDTRNEWSTPDGEGGDDLFVASEDSGWLEADATPMTTERILRARIEVDALGGIHALYVRQTLSVWPYNNAVFAATSPLWQEYRVSDGNSNWYACDFALDSAGQGRAVWTTEDGSQVMYADEATGWVDVAVRSPPPAGPFSQGLDPTIALDIADVVHIVWTDTRKTDPSGWPSFSEIWHASSSDGFANSEIALPDDAAPMARKFYPKAQVDAAGILHVAFLADAGDGIWNLYYSNSTDWSRGVRVTNRTGSDGTYSDAVVRPFRFAGPSSAPNLLFTDNRAGVDALWVTEPWDLAPDTTPPFVPPQRDVTVDANVGVQLSARGAWDNDRIASYLWTIGATTIAGAQPWFVPTVPGTYPSSLTVRDPGGRSASSPFVLTVRPAQSWFWAPPRSLYSIYSTYGGRLELFPWTGTAFPVMWLAWDSFLSYQDAAGRTAGGRIPLGQAFVRQAAAWDPAGSVHIVGTDTSGSQVMYEKRRGDGAALIAPTALPLGGVSPAELDLAFAGGYLWAAWSDSRDGNREIYVAALDLTGGIVSGPLRISNNNRTSFGPRLVPSDGRVWVVWGDDRGWGDAVYGSAVNVTTFAVEVQELRIGFGYLDDVAALPGGGAAVTSHIRAENGVAEVWLYRVDSAGALLSPPVPLSFDDGATSAPSSVTTDAQGTAHIAWVDMANDTWVRYARVPLTGPPEPDGGAIVYRAPLSDQPFRVSAALGPDGEPRVAFAGGLPTGVTVSMTYRDPIPPTAVIAGPTSANVGQTVTFSGSSSFDNAEIANYDWSFGDGIVGTGESVTHRFDSGGTYTVRLTVADRVGNADAAEVQVAVADAPPVARIAGPSSTDEDIPVTFSGAGSTDDGGIRRYLWTVLGPTTSSYEGPTITVNFTEPGTYTVRLTVEDNGGRTDVAELVVSVRDVFEPGTANAILWAGTAGVVAVTIVLLAREWRKRTPRKPIRRS